MVRRSRDCGSSWSVEHEWPSTLPGAIKEIWVNSPRGLIITFDRSKRTQSNRGPSSFDILVDLWRIWSSTWSEEYADNPG